MYYGPTIEFNKASEKCPVVTFKVVTGGKSYHATVDGNLVLNPVVNTQLAYQARDGYWCGQAKTTLLATIAAMSPKELSSRQVNLDDALLVMTKHTGIGADKQVVIQSCSIAHWIHVQKECVPHTCAKDKQKRFGRVSLRVPGRSDISYAYLSARGVSWANFDICMRISTQEWHAFYKAVMEQLQWFQQTISGTPMDTVVVMEIDGSAGQNAETQSMTLADWVARKQPTVEQVCVNSNYPGVKLYLDGAPSGSLYFKIVNNDTGKEWFITIDGKLDKSNGNKALFAYPVDSPDWATTLKLIQDQMRTEQLPEELGNNKNKISVVVRKVGSLEKVSLVIGE